MHFPEKPRDVMSEGATKSVPALLILAEFASLGIGIAILVTENDKDGELQGGAIAAVVSFCFGIFGLGAFFADYASLTCCQECHMRVYAIFFLLAGLLSSLPSSTLYIIAALNADEQKALIGAGAAFSILLTIVHFTCFCLALCCNCCCCRRDEDDG